MNVHLLPEALEEASNAAPWYDQRRPGLGDEFLAELQFALSAVEFRSHGMPALESYSGPHDIRRQLLKRFPYMVVIALRDEECLIVAIAHTRRRPLYWLNRLGWRESH